MLKMRHIISIVAILSILGIPQACAIKQDQLDVRMIYLTKIEQGATYGLLLFVSSMGQNHPMKINWTGIHVDWQAEFDFFENTTKLDLFSGQSVSIGLSVHCPRGTPLGKHSDYIMIEYLVQDGPNSTWNSHYWMSQESEDFEVITAPVTASGPGPVLSWLNANFCVLGIIVIIVVIVALSMLTIKDVKKKMKAGVQPPGGSLSQPGMPQTWGSYPSGSGVTPYQSAGAPYDTTADSAAKACPYCGTIATGEFCSSCGRMLWE